MLKWLTVKVWLQLPSNHEILFSSDWLLRATAVLLGNLVITCACMWHHSYTSSLFACLSQWCLNDESAVHAYSCSCQGMDGQGRVKKQKVREHVLHLHQWSNCNRIEFLVYLWWNQYNYQLFFLIKSCAHFIEIVKWNSWIFWSDLDSNMHEPNH